MRALPVITLSLSPLGLLVAHELGKGNQTDAVVPVTPLVHQSERQSFQALSALPHSAIAPSPLNTLPEFSTTDPLSGIQSPTTPLANSSQIHSQPERSTAQTAKSTQSLPASNVDSSFVNQLVANTLKIKPNLVSVNALPSRDAVTPPKAVDSVQEAATLPEPKLTMPFVKPELAVASISPPETIVQSAAFAQTVNRLATNVRSSVTAPAAALDAAPTAPDAAPAVALADVPSLAASPAPDAPAAVPSASGQSAATPSSALLAQSATAPQPSSQSANLPAAADKLLVAQVMQSSAPFQPHAPAVSAATSANPTTGVDQTYVLGPGDIIQLNFFNVPEYNGQQQILVDGTVSLPLVGAVSLAGKTLRQAEAAIGDRYSSELQYPKVSVNLVQPRAVQVTLAGEITQPGSYTLATSPGGQFPNIVQAIQTGGGTTQSADLTQVQIRRRRQGNTYQTFNVNLLQLVQTGDPNQNATLRDGDIVFLPATTEINVAQANQLAVSNLRTNTNQPVDVAVVGEVLRPGPYRMDTANGTKPTLIQAIQQAGGITPAADLRQVQIKRKTRQGEEQSLNVDLWNLLQTGDLNQDIVLQPGDTVSIPVASTPVSSEVAALAGSTLSTGTINVNLVGEVKSPGKLQLQANTTLSQAVLAAGGLNQRGRKTVRLVRFNSNGTVTQQEIKFDPTQGLDPSTNPILRNNDVVIVGRTTFAQISDTLNDIFGVFGHFSQFLPF